VAVAAGVAAVAVAAAGVVAVAAVAAGSFPELDADEHRQTRTTEKRKNKTHWR
jgi:hypothetical protein